jgi:hypothetical protein
MGDGFMTELFTLPPHAIEAAKLRARHKIRGHAAQPGTGPTGETCKSCRHYAHKVMANTYRKCVLRQNDWTGGPGTDVRAGDPACAKWESPE